MIKEHDTLGRVGAWVNAKPKAVVLTLWSEHAVCPVFFQQNLVATIKALLATKKRFTRTTEFQIQMLAPFSAARKECSTNGVNSAPTNTSLALRVHKGSRSVRVKSKIAPSATVTAAKQVRDRREAVEQPAQARP